MAREFNGSTDRIDYGSVFDPSGSDVSVACWVYPDALSSSQRLWVAHDSGDSSLGCMLFTDSVDLAFFRKWSTAWERRYRYGAGGLGTGSWQHVVGTSTSGGRASGMELYVDGAVPGSTDTDTGSGSETAHSGSWSLGGQIYDDSANLDGKLAEVAVWDRILDAAEITALAKGFAPPFFLRGLRFYVPLIGRKDCDLAAGKTPTYDGTTVAVHPRIIYPS